MPVQLYALPIPAGVAKASAPPEPRDVSLTATNTGRGVATTSFGIMGTAIGEASDKIQDIAPFSPIIVGVSVFLLLLGVGLSMYGIMKTIREERAV